MWLVKSTKIIAFFATRPINMMKPKMVKIPMELLVNASANNAPISDKWNREHYYKWINETIVKSYHN